MHGVAKHEAWVERAAAIIAKQKNCLRTSTLELRKSKPPPSFGNQAKKAKSPKLARNAHAALPRRAQPVSKKSIKHCFLTMWIR